MNRFTPLLLNRSTPRINIFLVWFLNKARSQEMASLTHSIDWNAFFRLKKQSSIINTSASLFSALIAGVSTLAYVGNIEIDLEKPIFGFDPLLIYGGSIFLAGSFGFVLGPFFGSLLFRVVNKKKFLAYKEMNKLFISKIHKNRVNPLTQSFSNPVPDYYGERIYSFKDYKTWLLDCKVYKQKSKKFL